jgi:pimeloyl-ACP methyl ester carboxylesterase
MDDDIDTCLGQVAGHARVQAKRDPCSGFRYVRVDPPCPGARVGVVFLHGAGERGGDPRRVLDYGLPATLVSGTHAIDAPVCCPHLAAGQVWDPASVACFMASLRGEFERMVLCGYSLGGSGACDLVAALGTVAELTIVVAGRSANAPGDVPLDGRMLFIEGEHDDWLDTSVLRRALAERGRPSTHLIIAGAGHFIAEAAMEQEAVVAGLAALGVTYGRRSPQELPAD